MSWIEEWNKFSDDAIKDMKKYSDKTHEEREWMCYVYEADGEYHLGNVTYGDESRIEVNPTAKHNEDALVNGLTNKKDRVACLTPINNGCINKLRKILSKSATP